VTIFLPLSRGGIDRVRTFFAAGTRPRILDTNPGVMRSGTTFSWSPASDAPFGRTGRTPDIDIDVNEKKSSQHDPLPQFGISVLCGFSRVPNPALQ